MASILCVSSYIKNSPFPIMPILSDDVTSVLIEKGHSITYVYTIEEALTTLEKNKPFFHVCLIDPYKLTPPSIRETIQKMKQCNLATEIIIYEDAFSSNGTISLMRNGAYRVEKKPADPHTLLMYLAQIEEEFTLFDKTAEWYQTTLLEKIKFNLKLANEFTRKRHMDGKLFTHEEFYYFFQNDEFKQTHALPSPTYPPHSTVLIVDDDPEYQVIFTDIFNQIGYPVLVAGNCNTALDFLTDPSLTIHVVCLDIGIPNRPDHTLIDAIQKNHPFAEIIVLTGQVKSKAGSAFFQDQPFEYITKPFLNDYVITTVTRALQRSYLKNMSPHMPLHPQGISLNTQQRLTLLKDIADLRLFLKTPVTLKDVYFFFPNLIPLLQLPETILVADRLFLKELPDFQDTFLADLTKKYLPCIQGNFLNTC